VLHLHAPSEGNRQLEHINMESYACQASYQNFLAGTEISCSCSPSTEKVVPPFYCIFRKLLHMHLVNDKQNCIMIIIINNF